METNADGPDTEIITQGFKITIIKIVKKRRMRFEMMMRIDGECNERMKVFNIFFP